MDRLAESEAALAEAVKERDELAAQWLNLEGAAFTLMSDSEPCDDADFLIVKAVHMEALDHARDEEPARAQALLNVIQAAKRWNDPHTAGDIATAELRDAIRALKDTKC